MLFMLLLYSLLHVGKESPYLYLTSEAGVYLNPFIWPVWLGKSNEWLWRKHGHLYLMFPLAIFSCLKLNMTGRRVLTFEVRLYKYCNRKYQSDECCYFIATWTKLVGRGRSFPWLIPKSPALLQDLRSMEMNRCLFKLSRQCWVFIEG